MPRARLTVTIPEEVWVGAVSRRHPEATLRILAAMPAEDHGVGLVQISAPDLPAVVRAVQDADAVTDLEILQLVEEEALVQFETSNPLLLFPVRSSGIPLELPFDITDGEATWDVTTSHDRLSELGEQLTAFGIRFRVDNIQRYVEDDQLLTERQERLVRTAVESGYYDTPRTCSLTELAEELGIAKSTCSETLHRAEGALVKHFVEGRDERPPATGGD